MSDLAATVYSLAVMGLGVLLSFVLGEIGRIYREGGWR